MAYYRLYFFGCGNRIEQFREFEVSDDFAAIRQAAEWRGTVPMELWSGARKIRRWDEYRSASDGGEGGEARVR